jgi:hypothetical protein
MLKKRDNASGKRGSEEQRKNDNASAERVSGGNKRKDNASRKRGSRELRKKDNASRERGNAGKRGPKQSSEGKDPEERRRETNRNSTTFHCLESPMQEILLRHVYVDEIDIPTPTRLDVHAVQDQCGSDKSGIRHVSA